MLHGKSMRAPRFTVYKAIKIIIFSSHSGQYSNTQGKWATRSWSLSNVPYRISKNFPSYQTHPQAITRSKGDKWFFQNCTCCKQQVSMANHINNKACCHVVQKYWKRPLAITLCKYSLCCQGYQCLHPLYIAGRLRWGWDQPGAQILQACQVMATEMDIAPQVSRQWQQWYWEGQGVVNGANEEKQEEEVVTTKLGRCAPASESLPPTIIKKGKRFSSDWVSVRWWPRS